MKYTYGLFQNMNTPMTGLPIAVVTTPKWSEAVRYFSDRAYRFGGGAVYNLKTNKHVATISA